MSILICVIIVIAMHCYTIQLHATRIICSIIIFFIENNVLEAEGSTSQNNLCGKWGDAGGTFIGQRVTVAEPGGSPVSPCVLPSPLMVSFATYNYQFNTECLITFFDALNERLVSPKERGLLIDLPCKEIVPLVHCNTAVRGVSCVSCVPASCFRIWFVSCNLVNSVPGVCD